MAAQDRGCVELRADNVGIVFPGRKPGAATTALSGITCELCHGDRLAVLGGNGSGKSTLLRTLAGLYVPTSGSVIAQGRVLGLFEYWQGLHPEATGWENVVMLGILQGHRRGEIEASRARIMDLAGLDAAIDRPVRGWSPGMMLRLAFAVATAWPPDILLVDEVLAVADASFTAMARTRLLELAETSAVIVLASHDLSLHRAIANRAVVLERGRIVFDGAVEAAITYYQPNEATAIWNG